VITLQPFKSEITLTRNKFLKGCVIRYNSSQNEWKVCGSHMKHKTQSPVKKTEYHMSVHPSVNDVQQCEQKDASAFNEHYPNLSITREKYI
jgi:hypothetical protein